MFTDEEKKKLSECFSGQILTTVFDKPLPCFERNNGVSAVYVSDNEMGSFIAESSNNIDETPNRCFPSKFQITGIGETEEEALDDFINKEEKLLINLLIYIGRNSKLLIEDSDRYNPITIIYPDMLQESFGYLRYEIEKHRIHYNKILTGLKVCEFIARNDKLYSKYIPNKLLIAVTENKFIGFRNFIKKSLTIENNNFITECRNEITMTMIVTNPKAIALGVPKELVDISLKVNCFSEDNIYP
jgi:hypothetical protein